MPDSSFIRLRFEPITCKPFRCLRSGECTAITKGHGPRQADFSCRGAMFAGSESTVVRERAQCYGGHSWCKKRIPACFKTHRRGAGKTQRIAGKSDSKK